MGKITITKSELSRIIKEEALKFKKAITLKGELDKINSELKKLNENEEISEVTAGSEMNATENGGVHAGQRKPNFSTKNGNPSLKMEDEEEITDVEADVETDADMDVDSDTVSKADLVKALDDLKMALGLIEGPADDMSPEEAPIEGGDDLENDEPANEEGDEIFEFDTESSKKEEGAPKMEECGIKENLDEPIEGESVVQNATEDKVNDNMKKDTHVSENTEVNSLMESEKKRMAQLAGIVKG